MADVTGSVVKTAQLATAQEVRLPTRAAPTSGETRSAEGRRATKSVRVAAKKPPGHPHKGHFREAAAKLRIIGDEDEPRKRKSGRGSASVDVKRRST